MTKVISFLGTNYMYLPEPDENGQQNSKGFKTAYYRRLLSELKRQPLSQHAFLRMLLKRALSTGAASALPVTNHAAQDPVRPS
jgi:hypothetical protein